MQVSRYSCMVSSSEEPRSTSASTALSPGQLAVAHHIDTLEAQRDHARRLRSGRIGWAIVTFLAGVAGVVGLAALAPPSSSDTVAVCSAAVVFILVVVLVVRAFMAEARENRLNADLDSAIAGLDLGLMATAPIPQAGTIGNQFITVASHSELDSIDITTPLARRIISIVEIGLGILSLVIGARLLVSYNLPIGSQSWDFSDIRAAVAMGVIPLTGVGFIAHAFRVRVVGWRIDAKEGTLALLRERVLMRADARIIPLPQVEAIETADGFVSARVKGQVFKVSLLSPGELAIDRRARAAGAYAARQARHAAIVTWQANRVAYQIARVIAEAGENATKLAA